MLDPLLALMLFRIFLLFILFHSLHVDLSKMLALLQILIKSCGLTRAAKPACLMPLLLAKCDFLPLFVSSSAIGTGPFEKAKELRSLVEHTTLKSITHCTELYYDPDITSTIVPEDKVWVDDFFMIPDENYLGLNQTIT